MTLRSLPLYLATGLVVAVALAVAIKAMNPSRTPAVADRTDPTNASARDHVPGQDFSATETPPAKLDIVTVLGFDAIPSIDAPRFVSVAEAERDFQPGEMVLGVSLNGEHHVYSVPMLSRHEIVNDVVGGVPVAVTW